VYKAIKQIAETVIISINETFYMHQPNIIQIKNLLSKYDNHPASFRS